MNEIERKFLVSRDWASYQLGKPDALSIVEQGTVFLGPNKELLRIYKEIYVDDFSRDDRYILALKRKTSDPTVRIEHEIHLTEDEYNQIKRDFEVKPLEKVRFYHNIGGLIYEIDFFKGNLEPLVVLEVEFNSKQEADLFVPEWDAEAFEVTSDSRYLNANLEVHGIPEDFWQRPTSASFADF